uniref:Histone deacetylase complex subunit SAP30 Sin3 binding domain-containing protein n=1 Tax=Picea sitchensis TaxID=3332 RepID=D5ACG1_PICSI|nr:unknown [Picea sitchensis]
MQEVVVYPQQQQGVISLSSPCCEDSGDEELSVLPKYTKVVVTGNNRTKSVLVGLRGVVKKAVGLGGWHWLELTNGIEVKLQRNALSVIEAPTGHDDADRNDCENVMSSSSELASDDFAKFHKSKHRPHKTVTSVSKTISKNHSNELQSTGSRAPSHGMLKVDLSKLETTALVRYWKHFNLVDAVPNPSKEQLIDIVQRHFMAQCRSIGSFFHAVGNILNINH